MWLLGTYLVRLIYGKAVMHAFDIALVMSSVSCAHAHLWEVEIRWNGIACVAKDAPGMVKP